MYEFTETIVSMRVETPFAKDRNDKISSKDKVVKTL